MACSSCNQVRSVLNAAAKKMGIQAQLPMLQSVEKKGVNPIWQKINSKQEGKK